MKIQVGADLLEGLVLAQLNQRDRYGYALTQRIQQSITISESTLYPVLRRLKAAGLVETYDQPFGGRNRRYYHITQAGVAHLQRVKQMWDDYKQSLDEIFDGRNDSDDTSTSAVSR